MLVCFTSNHHTARFDLLERLERHAGAITDALSTQRPELISGSVVLATCNRFEAYLDIDEPLTAARAVAVETLIDAISSASQIDQDELRAASTVICDRGVAEHLFAVSSGLESIVVGEGEIAGQVRRALHAARAAGTVTRDLDRLFQTAARTSRGVKNNTGIASAGRSIVRLALELAASRITDWAQARVLLVGTGAYAGASLAALRDRGATDIRVFSRTGRAATFATSHGIAAVPTTGLADAVASSDLVVTCSVAPTVILDRATLDAAMQLPGALQRRLIIDLGLPRNVDPAVARVAGVELLDLETISLHAPLKELGAEADARAIVGQAAAAFAAQTAEQQVEPALVALRSHVFGVLDAEIDRLRAHHDSETADTAQTEAALRHLVGVLLHTPSVRARELARNGEADTFISGANAVFGVAIEPESATGAGRLRAVESGQEAS
ncbi:glutamyl-tRNA reductase [Rathayibacter soli]|uniref:glutamyl-tRNA reductase n=1 Tax=Rathayibacter soli TaxID=3144168 RepID=UPI0027E43735|nr:glutamyl-tRNA reductase [Glaciibacter superstes]